MYAMTHNTNLPYKGKMISYVLGIWYVCVTLCVCDCVCVCDYVYVYVEGHWKSSTIWFFCL